ncbi:MAG: hypothetical protein PWQ29_1268 [Verrucomicrobiota bacterium]|nr:hypothetical protein [Verrucomicrobiota bacterium]MDK2963874.1 hypothetical protein [Verrucomicrobiota bacterium]
MGKVCGLFLSVLVVTAFPVSSALADLGLQQSLDRGGAQAVAQVVEAAARAAYASSESPAAIESQLVAILNEASATGSAQAVSAAIAAIIQAGGVHNIYLASAAVDASDVAVDFPQASAIALSNASGLLGAGGPGGSGAGTGFSDGGSNPFDAPASSVDDADVPATRI